MQRPGAYSPGGCCTTGPKGGTTVHEKAANGFLSARARSTGLTQRFDPKSIFLGALLAYVVLLHSPGWAGGAGGRQRRDPGGAAVHPDVTIAGAAAPCIANGVLRLKGARSVWKHKSRAQTAGVASAEDGKTQPGEDGGGDGSSSSGGGGGGGRVFPMTGAALVDAGTSRAVQRRIVPDVQVRVCVCGCECVSRSPCRAVSPSSKPQNSPTPTTPTH
jgi:hypothetical protein